MSSKQDRNFPVLRSFVGSAWETMRSSFFLNSRFRAIIVQVVIVGSALWIFYLLASQAAHNLSELGIKSGFRFLGERAGFFIGEGLPLPRLERGLLSFAAAVLVAAFSVWLLSAWARAKGRTVGGDFRLVVLRLVLLFGIPGLTVYATGDTIRTEAFTQDSSMGEALIAGISNTIRVALLTFPLTTLIGLLVAIMRLSNNWLFRALGRIYVDLIRNLPFLLHIFFWYFAILATVPSLQNSINIGDTIFINKRGIFLPDIVPLPGVTLFFTSIIISSVVVYLMIIYNRIYLKNTYNRLPIFLYAALIYVTIPAISVLIKGPPFSLTYPVLDGFSMRDATVLTPEYFTLVIAISLYGSTFVAEIIRGGVQSVPRGQVEAATALGLRKSQIFRLVVFPLTLRVIIPPMISRYVGLIKGSSLGVVVGYPEIVGVAMLVEFETGQALEVVVVTMAFYLTIGLATATLMNRYNARIQLTRED